MVQSGIEEGMLPVQGCADVLESAMQKKVSDGRNRKQLPYVCYTKRIYHLGGCIWREVEGVRYHGNSHSADLSVQFVTPE